MIAPKMATEMPAAMIVSMPVPSQTIKRGASADFGRLFKTTRNGSKISDNRRLYHKSVAVERLTRATRKKLITVSVNVIPIWVNRERSETMRTKQATTREGLEKKKLSMIWKSANNSQTVRKRSSIKIRAKWTK